MTSDVTGADVNFEHRSYHCATLTHNERAHCIQSLFLLSV
jgi:hypothetical protein